jgi:nucleoside-diphosphate-sugar epimerase
MKWIQQAHRTVYLSATGVYGSQSIVDERTLPTPETARTKARVAAEEAILGSRGGLVLRPAAIYGPGRGVHIAVREGTFRLAGDGSNFVSRIHVDDLTAHCQAALFSDLGGAWPVADEEPCTSREIAEFCTALYGGTPLRAAGPAELGETRRADRRVDGSAVRRLLNIQLRYPSYRAGIPACIAEEALTPFPSNSIVRAR